MKKAIYRVLGWAAFALGALFIILPIIPGLPLIFLSASLFGMA